MHLWAVASPWLVPFVDFMREGKELCQAYSWEEMPRKEAVSRSRRFERRLQELGYPLADPIMGL